MTLKIAYHWNMQMSFCNILLVHRALGQSDIPKNKTPSINKRPFQSNMKTWLISFIEGIPRSVNNV